MGEHPAFLKMAHAAEAFYTFRQMGMGGTSRTTGHLFGWVLGCDGIGDARNIRPEMFRLSRTAYVPALSEPCA
jgi:hypothetical protein